MFIFTTSIELSDRGRESGWYVSTRFALVPVGEPSETQQAVGMAAAERREEKGQS
jgi:hypothetical protein